MGAGAPDMAGQSSTVTEIVDTPSLSDPTQSAGTVAEKLKAPPLLVLVTATPSQVIVALLAALLPWTTANPFWTSASVIVIASAIDAKPTIEIIPKKMLKKVCMFFSSPRAFQNTVPWQSSEQLFLHSPTEFFT